MKSVRFLFSLSGGLHREIKIRAAMRNINMGDWVRQAILQRIAGEQKYENKDENGKQ